MPDKYLSTRGTGEIIATIGLTVLVFLAPLIAAWWSAYL